MGFKDLVNQVGPTKALEVISATASAGSVLTVQEWIQRHIDHLTGVEQATVRRYRAYLVNDIEPSFGAMPLVALSRDEVALWVNAMFEEGASGKTIANKHRFLSGALNAAVTAGHTGKNPCHGLRLPRWERREMVFLTESEFATLHNSVTEYWRPFVEFLVASGARWSEATALRPRDVDREQGTVRITRAFTAVGQHHRHIGQHLAPIMARHERAPRQGNRELTGEPGPVGQKPQASTTGMGHHARPIARYRQPRRPRSTLHLRSAFQFGDLETSQSQEFLTGQALPCIYTPTIPITRERSGLVR
jgi:integrase